MKKLSTLSLLLLVSLFIYSQTSNFHIEDSNQTPTSFSELNGETNVQQAHVVKQNPIPNQNSNSGKTPGGLTFYTDRTSFDADNPGLPVETWPSSFVGANSVCSNFSPLNENTNDGCFSAGDVMPGIEINMLPVNDDYVILQLDFLVFHLM